MSFRLSYHPALDGFRVLAIAPVLALHAGSAFMLGGHIGVDLFFTLSGFLITSLLLRDGIEPRQFWKRRALRLVPPLLLVVAVVTVIRVPGATNREAIAALFYVTNWTRVAGLTGDGPLSHTWSLAIEEQYYILWPLLLAPLLRWVPDRKRLAGLVLGLACACAVWRFLLYTHGASNTRVYNGLDTRADSILVGSALALLLSTDFYSQMNVRLIRLLSVASMVVLGIIAIAMRVHSPFMYRYGYFVVPICVAVLITSIVTEENWWFERLLAGSAMAWVGRISYGIYLWHVPVYRLMAAHDLKGRYQLTFGSVITVGLAAFSYYTIERVARRLKPRPKSEAELASVGLQSG